jgi:UDP-N-acetylmuramate--alanine ligase
MKRKIGHIHFVGIGGIGMSGIAEVLLNLGYTVSGSDISRTDITERLASLGASVCYNHRSSNVGHAGVVVTSTAVKEENPEVVEARSRNIPVIPRAEMLAELLKMKFSIAVSGCHGKTTTTSIISTVLAYGGLDPTMVIGGRLDNIGSNARLGDGEVIVAEADESDGSFLKLSPSISVVTNIDREHLDYYLDIGEIKDAFLQFANSVPFYGATVLCNDCMNIKDILPRIKRRVITYGISEPSDYRATDISFKGMQSSYVLHCKGEPLGDISIRVPGLFNVYNSMAAIAVAREMDMAFSTIQQGLLSYTGVHRRLEIKGTVSGITVVDDYGHHPTEIMATLTAARQVWQGRLIIVFQPHRYTRTKALFNEFTGAFYNADVLIITDIYAASEKEVKGVDAISLCRKIKDCGHEHASYLASFDEIVNHLKKIAEPGDTIITLGAGDVWKVGEKLLHNL